MSNRRFAHGWLLAAVLTVMIPVGQAQAQEARDKPTAPTPAMTLAQAADQVLAVRPAEDGATLKALAEKDDPNPWLVADELLLRGEDEAALAFAKAAPRPDTERLPGYLVSQEGVEENRAARVICSLWKVDDEATQALMVKFYELWNPPPESDRPALSAATALRETQAFIRDHPDHPEWTHPCCWAAWSLWGLP